MKTETAESITVSVSEETGKISLLARLPCSDEGFEEVEVLFTPDIAIRVGRALVSTARMVKDLTPRVGWKPRVIAGGKRDTLPPDTFR